MSDYVRYDEDEEENPWSQKGRSNTSTQIFTALRNKFKGSANSNQRNMILNQNLNGLDLGSYLSMLQNLKNIDDYEKKIANLKRLAQPVQAPLNDMRPLRNASRNVPNAQRNAPPTPPAPPVPPVHSNNGRRHTPTPLASRRRQTPSRDDIGPEQPFNVRPGYVLDAIERIFRKNESMKAAVVEKIIKTADELKLNELKTHADLKNRMKRFRHVIEIGDSKRFDIVPHVLNAIVRLPRNEDNDLLIEKVVDHIKTLIKSNHEAELQVFLKRLSSKPVSHSPNKFANHLKAVVENRLINGVTNLHANEKKRANAHRKRASGKQFFSIMASRAAQRNLNAKANAHLKQTTLGRLKARLQAQRRIVNVNTAAVEREKAARARANARNYNRARVVTNHRPMAAGAKNKSYNITPKAMPNARPAAAAAMDARTVAAGTAVVILLATASLLPFLIR